MQIAQTDRSLTTDSPAVKLTGKTCLTTLPHTAAFYDRTGTRDAMYGGISEASLLYLLTRMSQHKADRGSAAFKEIVQDLTNLLHFNE
jgi:hypothetical protein